MHRNNLKNRKFSNVGFASELRFLTQALPLGNGLWLQITILRSPLAKLPIFQVVSVYPSELKTWA